MIYFFNEFFYLIVFVIVKFLTLKLFIKNNKITIKYKK